MYGDRKNAVIKPHMLWNVRSMYFPSFFNEALHILRLEKEKSMAVSISFAKCSIIYSNVGRSFFI